MEKYPRLAVVVALVSEGILHLDLVVRGGAREHVVAHCNGYGAIQVDRVVVKDHLGPALAAVDGKPGVLIVTIFHGASAHEVRHGLASSWSEGELCGLGGLEENLRVPVAVELASSVSGLLRKYESTKEKDELVLCCRHAKSSKEAASRFRVNIFYNACASHMWHTTNSLVHFSHLHVIALFFVHSADGGDSVRPRSL